MSDKSYGSKETIIINSQNGIEAIKEINNIWGIENNFFFSKQEILLGMQTGAGCDLCFKGR